MDSRDHVDYPAVATKSFVEKAAQRIYHSLRRHRRGSPYHSYWWFRGRRRFLQSLLSSLKIAPPTLILDGGCGTGEDLNFITKLGKVLAVDLRFKSLKGVVTQKVQGDLRFLPFADGQFDVVLSFDTLEHILEDEQVAKEFFRILKRKGLCVASVPAYPLIYSTHDRFLEHVRRYSRKRFVKIFQQSGFKILQLTYWNFFAAFPIALIRILRKFFFWVVERKPLSDISRLPYWANWILYRLLVLEAFLIVRLRIPLPFGISLFGVFQKETAN